MTAANELAPPTPSKFSAVTAVLSIDSENASSLLIISACQAAALAIVVAVPAAPGPTNRR